MKFYTALALVGIASAVKITNNEPDFELNVQLDSTFNKPCEEALEVSVENLNVELDYFSRRWVCRTLSKMERGAFGAELECPPTAHAASASVASRSSRLGMGISQTVRSCQSPQW